MRHCIQWSLAASKVRVLNDVSVRKEKSLVCKLIHNVATRGTNLADYQLQADVVSSAFNVEELESAPPLNDALNCEMVALHFVRKVLKSDFPTYTNISECDDEHCPERSITRTISMLQVCFQYLH